MKRWFVAFLIIFIDYQSFAQLMVSSNVLLTISSGATLTVKGDVVFTGTSIVENSGTISLTGNWINNAGVNLFNSSKGEVLLNGNIQQILGSFSTTFYHLTMQNGTKIMNVNTGVGGSSSPYNGVLNLTNAIFSLKSNMLSVYNPVPGGIQRTTGFILSEDPSNAAKVWWVNVGANLHTIPFGNNAGEDVSFSFTSSPPTGFQVGSLRVSTYQTLPNNTPFPFSPVAINHVNNTTGTDNSANTVDRFWHIEHTGTSSYYFKFAPSENAANGNTNMRAQPWNTLNSGWQLPSVGQTNPTMQQVFVPGVLPLSPGILAGKSWALAMNATPLPVTLLSFDAKLTSNRHVKCEWSTLTETNNDYFVVQRSNNGYDFIDVGIRDGAGNSSTFLNYTFIDEYTPYEITYYRLKQVDFDGQFTFSKNIAIQSSGQSKTIRVFPNPASEIVNFSFEKDGQFQYVIYDLTGKKIMQKTSNVYAGLASFSVSDIQEGSYLLEVIIDEISNTHPLKIIRP